MGLGSAVARALVETTFASMPDISRVEAHLDEGNRKSRRVAERAGMSVVDSHRRTPRTSSETPTELIFAIERGKT